MTDIENIKIGIGLGDIKFGVSREELIKKIGDPTEIDQYTPVEDEDYLTESWHYDENELSVSFDEEDNWRLTTIAISSPNSLFHDIKLIGKKKGEVLDLLKDLNLIDPELEKLSDDSNHLMASFIESSINFWFENDLLSEIQWGVLWEDEDTPKWPS